MGESHKTTPALNTRKAGKGVSYIFIIQIRFGHCTLQELIIWEKLPRCDEVSEAGWPNKSQIIFFVNLRII